MDSSEPFRNQADTAQMVSASRVKQSPAIPLRQRLYGPILQPLADVESTLQAELQSPHCEVAELLHHGMQLGGKRLRPAIHLLMAEALGGCQSDNVVIAAVLEMVHTATLVHDDVLDAAQTRRHVPTINALWNNHTSILVGDYLFAQSFRLAATLGETRTCQWVGEAARLVCEGELRQVLGRDDLQLDRETYFQIIQGKTAELCRVACSLAAAQAGCDAVRIDELAEYGNSLGIAFQIADDYLDLWGDDQAVGKTLGTDLDQGKITLPVMRLLETADPLSREQIIATLRGPVAQRGEQIRARLDASDARQFTLSTAAKFKNRALAAIADLPASDAKQCLIEIAEFSILRSF
ncbi:polyprenyl synthetase family protein [Stieleria sp. TO1_6]|uniref:polyprenyl synthetase family protein n=1 Tax=Stieleria tagensis TaxID=2956795 RepID=UPI00209B97DF|nr:polyprenyl synthetase family protein [Stieleria tagensis]MCO8123700.1 polyprenyl synthetase family protein [Stieleria tagensis]